MADKFAKNVGGVTDELAITNVMTKLVMVKHLEIETLDRGNYFTSRLGHWRTRFELRHST